MENENRKKNTDFQKVVDFQKIIDFQKVIDFHTHPYLDVTENSCLYKEDFQLTAREAREDLEKAGITHICGSVIEMGGYPTKAEAGKRTAHEESGAAKDGIPSGIAHIRSLNEKALQIKEMYGDFYTPGFHIHPGFVKESLEIVEWMHENGHRLIGELVPYMHGWKELGLDYGSDALREILNLVGKYHMIVSFHTMTEWEEQMEQMIAAHPDVTFVAAHPGEKADCLKHLERMEKYENAFLDLSGTGLARYGMLREAIRRVGAERILFGTDYPIMNPGMYVEAVRFEHISREERELIFWKNAERILTKKG